MMKKIVAVLLACAALSAFADDGSSNVSKDVDTFRVTAALPVVSVAYSWADAISVLKTESKHDSYITITKDANYIGWTLTSGGKVIQQDTILDRSDAPNGAGIIDLGALDPGKYKLTLTGSWTTPEDLAKGSSRGSVSLDKPIFSAVSMVPEPESYAMLLSGLCVLGIATRRRKQT